MKSYRSAISWAVHDSMNMPDPERYPTKFIEWGEDICGLIAEIYECAFEDVVEDLHKALEITEE
jgi:hypothetical protein